MLSYQPIVNVQCADSEKNHRFYSDLCWWKKGGALFQASKKRPFVQKYFELGTDDACLPVGVCVSTWGHLQVEGTRARSHEKSSNQWYELTDGRTDRGEAKQSILLTRTRTHVCTSAFP